MKLFREPKYWREACAYCKGYDEYDKCYCSLRYKLWFLYKRRRWKRMK